MNDFSVDLLLAAAKIPGGETLILSQPEETYAAWGEEIYADGSDYDNELRKHEVIIELYELMDTPDPAAHKRLQAALDQFGLSWHKAPRVIELTSRLFLTTYTFEYVTRR